MAKKKGFHNISIRPKAGTHYEVHHEPAWEGKGNEIMPTDSSDENEKLFAHGERGQLHKHIDDLMDAHEGKSGAPGGITSADELPPDHPIHNLKRRMM